MSVFLTLLKKNLILFEKFGDFFLGPKLAEIVGHFDNQGIVMTRCNRTLASITAVLALAATGAASASVIKLTPNADLAAPYTVAVGDGAASYTFSSRNTPFDRPIGVSTTGTGEVLSFGEPFYDPPQPTSYFPNQAFGPAEGGTYVGYNDRTGRISSSTGDVYIGLRYALDDGLHYGYARVAGYFDNVFDPTLISFGYQTTPDTAITTGEMPESVPEPSAIGMLLAGLGLIGGLLWRRRRQHSLAV